MSESDNSQGLEEALAALQSTGSAILAAMTKQSAREHVYSFPAVRISSERFRALLEAAIVKVDAAISAAEEREKNRPVEADLLGGAFQLPGGMSEAEHLRQHRGLLVFTAEHLVPDASFEMEARHAYNLLNSDGFGRPLAYSAPVPTGTPIAH